MSKMNAYPLDEKVVDGDGGLFEETLAEKLITTFTDRADERPFHAFRHGDMRQIPRDRAYRVFPRGVLIPFA